MLCPATCSTAAPVAPPGPPAPWRNTLFEVQPPQGVDERRLAHVGHTNHQDAVLSALEVRRMRVIGHPPQKRRAATTAKQPSICQSFCASSLTPPAGEGGDLQTATLTPCTCAGSLAATSHLSPVVAWAVAHQLGNQGNNLQRDTEKGSNYGSAPRLAAATCWEDAVPGGCAKWGPSGGPGHPAKLEMKMALQQPASLPYSGALRPPREARTSVHSPQLPPVRNRAGHRAAGPLPS